MIQCAGQIRERVLTILNPVFVSYLLNSTGARSASIVFPLVTRSTDLRNQSVEFPNEGEEHRD